MGSSRRLVVGSAILVLVAVGGNAERTNFVTIMRFIGEARRASVLLCFTCVLNAFVQNLTINNIKN